MLHIIFDYIKDFISKDFISWFCMLAIYCVVCFGFIWSFTLPLEYIGAIVSIAYIISCIALQIVSDWYFEVNKK
jgi:hypothetical protein